MFRWSVMLFVGITLLVGSITLSCSTYSDVPKINTSTRNVEGDLDTSIVKIVGKLNGGLVKIIDMDGHQFLYTYNHHGEGRAIGLVHRPDCIHCESVVRVVSPQSTTYAGQGERIRTVKDNLGRTHTWVYDSDGGIKSHTIEGD